MAILPLWNELPQIELYMDQVLLYINNLLENELFLSDKQLTPSMINNYVKHGILTKPIKKKYTSSHIAKLIVIAYFKPIFSINDINDSINIMLQTQKSNHLYNDFVLFWTKKIDSTLPLIQYACQSLQYYKKTTDTLSQLKGE